MDQFVTFPTRQKRALDKCYSNIPNALEKQHSSTKKNKLFRFFSSHFFYRFQPFNCCLSVVLQLDKGDYPKKFQIVCLCLLSVLLNLLCVCINILPHHTEPRSEEKSDHEVLYLVPKYRQKLNTEESQTREIKQRTSDCMEELRRGCFESTEWSVSFDSCSGHEELAGTLTHYSWFCEDSVITSKSEFSWQ